MSPKQGLAFVKRHGIVLQAARGPVPSLAEAIAGGPIRGSWWGHPKGQEIFRVAEAVSEDADVLVCKLVEGKVTYLHRRVWPALVKLAPRFRRGQLARSGTNTLPLACIDPAVFPSQRGCPPRCGGRPRNYPLPKPSVSWLHAYLPR